jgi:hypothetical protein
MRLKRTITAKILVVFLIYVFMAGNTSGELALCIGAHWHIALEPLSHEHNENHPHIEHDTSSTEHEHNGHVENPHCRPCIDIPIFIGPTDNRLPAKHFKPNQKTIISLSETETLADDSFVLQASPLRIIPPADENRFLRSVILLV